MNIQEAEKEYPALDLYALTRLIRVFLDPYRFFVESVCLYHGVNKQPYHIIFKIPIVPERQRTQSVPTVQECQDKPQKVPKTAAELYEEFYEIIEGPPDFGSLKLDEVYCRGKTNPEPFGSPGYYDWPGSEWAWSIADGNHKLLPEFGVMEDIVLPGDPVLLYEKPNAKNTITAGDKGSIDPSPISPSLEDEVINYFRKNGNFWQIRYQGKTATVKNLHGIHYIVHLLQRPEMPISCRELYQIVSGKMPNNVMSEDMAIGQGLNVESSTQSVNDKNAKKDYWKRYQELQSDLTKNEGTPEFEIIKKETEREMADLLSSLRKRRFANPDNKKIQDNMKRRLDTTYTAIGKAGMEELEQHLQTSIKTGGSYDLIYTGSIIWNIIL